MPHPAPLGDPELEALARWERSLRRALVGALALLGVWAVIIALVGDQPWAPTLAVLFASPLAVLFYVAQTRRCPRCGTRIALGPGLRLPARCASCGVALRRDVD